MPANRKYLMQSGWAQTSKFLAAFLGGLLASVGTFMAAALWLGFTYVVPTYVFGVFILWVGYMLLVYWIERPLKSWGVILTIILISAIGIYFGKF